MADLGLNINIKNLALELESELSTLGISKENNNTPDGLRLLFTSCGCFASARQEYCAYSHTEDAILADQAEKFPAEQRLLKSQQHELTTIAKQTADIIAIGDKFKPVWFTAEIKRLLDELNKVSSNELILVNARYDLIAVNTSKLRKL